jgi:hypothetical protein
MPCSLNRRGGGSEGGWSIDQVGEAQIEHRIEVRCVPVAVHIALGEADIGRSHQLARGTRVSNLDVSLGARFRPDEVLLGAVVEDELKLSSAKTAEHERHKKLGQRGESVAG